MPEENEGPPPVQTVVNETRIPANLEPYYTRLLNHAQGTMGDPYQAYGGQRFAGFTGMENAAQAGIGAYGMGQGPQQMQWGTNMVGNAASGLGSLAPQMADATNQGYQSMYNLANQYGGLGNLANQYGNQAYTNYQGIGNQMAQLGGQAATGTQNLANVGTSDLYNRYQQFGQGYGGNFRGIANQFASGPNSVYANAGALGTSGQEAFQGIGADAAANTPMYAAPEGSDTPTADMSQYMNPYAENVMQAQERAALSTGRRQMADLSSRAGSSGAFGGYRHGLLEGDISRDTRQEMNDIRSRGLNTSFQNAQSMFEADRAARFQGRGQQLAAQQAAQGAGQWGIGAQADALRGRQAALGAGQGADQFALSGLGNILDRRLAAQQQAYTMGQTGMTGQMGAYGLADEARNTALGTNMNAMNQQMGGYQSANQFLQSGLGQQQGMYGQMAGMGGQMAGLGGQEQQQFLARMAAMEAAGQRQRGLQQAGLDYGYQNFQNQVRYPQQQMGWFSNILQAMPAQTTHTQNQYQQQPGLFQSSLGTGLASIGAYNAIGGNSQ